MNDVEAGWERLESTAAGMTAQFVAYLPNLIGAILLLLIGYVLARLLRALAVRVAGHLNRLNERLLPASASARLKLSGGATALVGTIIFWAVMLVFVAAAAEMAELDAFSTWLDRVVSYLPAALAGALIIFVGYFLSTIVRDLVAAPLHSAGFAQAELIGAAAQGVTLFAAVIIGIDQIGIDVTFLVVLAALILGSILISFALAFGLGARDLVANLIATHHLRAQIKPGQRARFDDVEGEVLEVLPTAVVLQTAEGQVVVPGSRFATGITAIIAADRQNG